MGNKLMKCENCGIRSVKQTSNYCGRCGYPTSKKLAKVDDPQVEINKALDIPHTIAMRVQYHGFIKVMKEKGLVSEEKANEITSQLKDFLDALLELQQRLDN